MFFVSLANNQSQEDVETMSNVTQSIFHSKFIYFLDNKYPYCQKKWPNHSQKKTLNKHQKSEMNTLYRYSTPPQLRYPELRYFRSYAILNWVQKNSCYAILAVFPRSYAIRVKLF